jgi:hypothetical protein
VTWDVLRAELEAELNEPVTIDALTGGWNIAQRAKGHRHSADDVLTAHFALQVAPQARTVLDLGTGIGGVGLLVLWGLPEATLVAIEAQPISHRLLLANIAGNGLAARVEPHLGDLRELADARRFPAARRIFLSMPASCRRTRRRPTPASSCAATSAITRVPPRAISRMTARSCSAFRPRSARVRSRR